jgi:uncharacterized protein (TIGR02996 family)
MTTATEEQKLLREVAANPDNDAPRLVMADWYEEQGDRRGEFIRTQCEMEHLRWDDAQYIQLETTADDLIAKHRAKWVKQLPKLPGVTWGNYQSAMSQQLWDDGRMYFRRGFGELLAIKDLKSFQNNLDALRDYGIASFPDFVNAHPKCFELLGELDFVRGVAFYQTDMDFGVIDRLKSRDKLQSLVLVECSLGAEGLRQLTRLSLPGLRSLDLHFNSLGDSLDLLAAWPATEQLNWLNIGLNDLGGSRRNGNATDHIGDFASQTSLANLSALDLWGNELQAEHIAVFAKFATMNRLTQLSLSRNSIQDDGVSALLQAKFRSLRMLNLSNNKITDQAVQAIAASPEMASLKRLNLSGNSGITDKSMFAIADSQHLAGLTHLNLPRTDFGEAGVKALIDSDSLSSVRYLNIGDNELKPATLKALQKRYPRAVVRKPYH